MKGIEGVRKKKKNSEKWRIESGRNEQEEQDMLQ